MASWKMQPDILAISLVAARYYLKFRAIALTLRARLHYLLQRPIGLALRPQPLMLVANYAKSFNASINCFAALRTSRSMRSPSGVTLNPRFDSSSGLSEGRDEIRPPRSRRSRETNTAPVSKTLETNSFTLSARPRLLPLP